VPAVAYQPWQAEEKERSESGDSRCASTNRCQTDSDWQRFLELVRKAQIRGPSNLKPTALIVLASSHERRNDKAFVLGKYLG
jgi:hypothetical protein